MMFRARTRGCLVLMGFVVGCLLSLSGVAAAAEPAPFQTYMVPMRDGVRLATDVQLPPGEGPWPVVLLRTCYDRKNSRVSDLKGRGYVLQDVRGRFDSEGRAVPFADDGWGERQDGLDTVRWILKQPWSNGKIATTGGSALGITQNLLAGTSPPGVVAQRIWVAPGSLYHHGVYPGGAFREGLWLGWLQSENWPADNGRLFQDHPSYDDFWKSLDTTARIEEKRVNIPAFHMGGWFDLFKEGTIASFVTRSRIANNQWLVMGPWPHSEAREVGELVFPPNALETPLSAWRWSEYWLEGKPNGLLDPPRLYYYVMGACGEEGAPGNEWRTADGWPIPAKETEFFVARDGQLVGEAPAEVGSYTYIYDPSEPVPTRGGNHLFESCGPMDQRELEKRADVLVFSTPPLPAPVEVTGQVRLRLAASSSATDTMFTAKLCDVYPDGRSMVVTDGVLRAACRESFARPTPIEPGKTYEFVVDLGSTSVIFNRGHRIRLDISSSNYPAFAVHPNVFGGGEPRPATQIISVGQETSSGPAASALILPVVDTESLRSRVWKPETPAPVPAPPR